MTTDPETPGATLAFLMRRRGWSAPRLAELAGGVSASSIRAYMANRTNPRPDHALALARALGLQDGKALLESWGYLDLADGFVEEWRPAGTEDGMPRPTEAHRSSLSEHPWETLSEEGSAVVAAVLAWIQHIEQSAAPGVRGPRHRSPAPQGSDDAL